MNSPTSTPESEIDASVTFSEALMEQINREDVKNMVTAQQDMLCRFEKTNEMLINFNILSANRFAVANNELKGHTQLMFEMKKDLDSIFKRIRVLKDRLNKSYPDAFKVCNVSPLMEDEEEGEEELRVTRTNQMPEDQQLTNQTADDQQSTNQTSDPIRASQTSDDQSGSSQTLSDQPTSRQTSEDQSSDSSNQHEDNKQVRKDFSNSETGFRQIDGEVFGAEASVEGVGKSDTKLLDDRVVKQEKLVDLD